MTALAPEMPPTHIILGIILVIPLSWSNLSAVSGHSRDT
jgi:hypothetical protein